MRNASESWLIVALATFAVTGFVAVRLGSGHDAIEPLPVDPEFVTEFQPAPLDAVAWFDAARRYCNPVDVETRMRLQPPPATPEGSMQEAACYALAGRIDRAREIVRGLPTDLHYRAAGVVFDAGHPAADAGDDVAAGPLMELVVEFWPNHYMALFHAGAARYELGDYALAQDYLERFMVEYSPEDGWRASARGMLQAMEERP